MSESQNEYCDVQAQADIREAMKARDGMLSVWVPTGECFVVLGPRKYRRRRGVMCTGSILISAGTPDDAAFLEPKMQTIQAFATAIIRPIAEVFKVRTILLFCPGLHKTASVKS